MSRCLQKVSRLSASGDEPLLRQQNEAVNGHLNLTKRVNSHDEDMNMGGRPCTPPSKKQRTQ